MTDERNERAASVREIVIQGYLLFVVDTPKEKRDAYEQWMRKAEAQILALMEQESTVNWRSIEEEPDEYGWYIVTDGNEVDFAEFTHKKGDYIQKFHYTNLVRASYWTTKEAFAKRLPKP